MLMQTKISVKAIPITLFACLYLVSVWSMAGSVSGANQTRPADAEAIDTSRPAALSHPKNFGNSMPTPTVALLERVRINGRQQAAKATFSLGIMAIDREDFSAAKLLIQEAIQLQPSHPGYWQAAAGLAFNMGALVDAEMYLMKSLELTRAELGGDDIRVVMLIDDLGTIYLAQQRYEQAEHTWRKSLSMREKILGNRHPSIVPRLNDLAKLAMHDSRFGETEKLLKRMVDILQSGAESDRTDVAIAKHILADFYINQQRVDEADALYRIVLTELRTAPTQQRLQIAADLYKLGNEYLSQLQLEEAKSQFELVLGLLEGDFEEDHPYVRGAQDGLNTLKVKREMRGRALDRAMDGKLQGQLSQRKQVM